MQKPPALILISLLAILPACNYPQAVQNTFSPEEIQTYAEQTAAVLQTETQQALQRTNAALQGETQPAIPTNTPQPVLTSTPLPTFTLTRTRTPTPVPCNWAYYVSDVTYPDYTKVAPSWTIEKTWRLRNIGSCTWTSGYQLIFDHGDRMDAPDAVQLTTGTVPPGSTVDATVILKTPAADGTYRGDFKLRSSEGLVFGIGASANEPF
jgi:hypothetical protein